MINLAFKSSIKSTAAFIALSAISMGFAQAAPTTSITTKTSPTAGCDACGPAPIQLAQVRPGGPRATQIDVGPIVKPKDLLLDPTIVRSCCDPAMANFKLRSMIAEDMIPGQSFDAPYGLVWNPSGNTPFLQAMENTAFMVNVMAGVSYSHFLIEGELRTRNIKNGVWPTNDPAVIAEWNAGTTMTPGWSTIMGVWDSPWLPITDPNFNLNWSHANPFSKAMAATSGPAHPPLTTGPHMRADGTIYTIKFTYWVAHFNERGEWIKRRVYCSNIPDQFGAYRKQSAGNNKLAAGATGGLESIGASEMPSQTGGQVVIGPPIKLTPAEIAKLPNAGRVPRQ